MTEVNISMCGLHDYPNDYKVRLKKMLDGIYKAGGLLDRDSLFLELKIFDVAIFDALIGTLAYHQLVIQGNEGRISLSDRGRSAFPLDCW